jgi:hypothetical protein
MKERVASLKTIRDQAQVDAARGAALLESSSQQAITPQMVRKFAKTARDRIRIEGGGYRRDHLRALAQRVEVADGEVRIMGSKGDLLKTLTAAPGVKSATPGVRSSVLKWRMGWDSNPRDPCGSAGFQDRCLQPLDHPSAERAHSYRGRQGRESTELPAPYMRGSPITRGFADLRQPFPAGAGGAPSSSFGYPQGIDSRRWRFGFVRVWP